MSNIIVRHLPNFHVAPLIQCNTRLACKIQAKVQCVFTVTTIHGAGTTNNENQTTKYTKKYRGAVPVASCPGNVRIKNMVIREILLLRGCPKITWMMSRSDLGKAELK